MTESEAAAKRPSHAIGFALAIGVALFAAVLCHGRLTEPHTARVAADFTWHWRAARMLLAGQNPYDLIQPMGAYPFNYVYLYPLPAAVLAIPFAPFPALWAGVAFIAITSFILAFVATREDYRHLPMFASVPFIWSCYLAQMSPLLTAALITPILAGTLVIKPHIGISVLAYRPRLLETSIGAILLLAVAFAIVPNWPADWLHSVSQRSEGFYRSPVTVVGGPLLLLATLRWRQPEARLLLVMALVPQNFTFFDQLPLWLVARTIRESSVLTGLSLVGEASLFLLPDGVMDPIKVMDVTAPAQILVCYLPCLFMVLRRPNSGELPSWLRQLSSLGKR